MADDWLLAGLFTADGTDAGDLEALRSVGAELERRSRGIALRLEDGPRDLRDLATDLALFAAHISALLSEDGETAHKLTLGRRRGRPRSTADSLEAAKRGHRAAAIVEQLVSEGWKQDAAVKQAEDTTGLSRGEVYLWLRRRRRFLPKSGK